MADRPRIAQRKKPGRRDQFLATAAAVGATITLVAGMTAAGTADASVSGADPAAEIIHRVVVVSAAPTAPAEPVPTPVTQAPDPVTESGGS